MITKEIHIIEDNQDILNLIKITLDKIKGVQLFTETDGIHGLEMIQSGNPSLIILDIELPRLNGREICKQLRVIENFKDTPIIAFAVINDIRIKRDLLTLGFTEVIPKMSGVKALRKSVLKHLR